MKKLTTEEFIKKAREVHGDKYDYSKVEYKGSREKICIICHKHGEFWQLPYDHLNGHGCTKCYDKEKRGKSRQLTTEQFIKQAKGVHGDKYDYSKTNYVDSHTKVCIICPEHGEFWQTPNSHISQKQGCPKCFRGKKMTQDEFIEKAKSIHGDKYDYSKVEYINNKTKVCIICPEHGEFKIRPDCHIHQKQGCPKCKPNYRRTQDEFIEKAKKIHGNKYDYSKVDYKNNITPVCIICPEHGEFWQKPTLHVNQKCGCPTCSESHIESEVRKFLVKNVIKFEREKKFNWLGLQRLDFYLNDYNIAIECQGIQHFERVEFFNNRKNNSDYLTYIKKLDKKKKELCEKHEVKLYYINFDDNIEKEVNKILDKISNKD